jgi:DNA-binding transcriptional MerR regulator
MKLSDLDRAKAVRNLRDSGMSLNQIASQLQCSPSNLRHLLLALDAPVEDKILARRGEISTNELARRSRAAGKRRAARHREETGLEQAREARRAANSVSDWLAEEGMSGPLGEQVIEETRRDFADRELTGHMPQYPSGVPELPRKELIQRCRPTTLPENNADYIDWYHQWLWRWAFVAFPDPVVRDDALELALQQQWKR